jgi:hypothetical protein
MALMYSVMLFLNASFVLLLLGFEFLALVNLLVYVGALAVLFLFVIMLLEIPATELRACGWSLLGLAGALACRVWLLPWPIEGVAIQAQPMLCGSESLCLLGHAFCLNYADPGLSPLGWWIGWTISGNASVERVVYQPSRLGPGGLLLAKAVALLTIGALKLVDAARHRPSALC